MFTRLATKLLGFRRRISMLIGYTGGESLEQIHFSEQVKEVLMQPYSLWHLEEEDAGIWGDEGTLRNLPVELKERPTFFVEGLPFYRRPYLYGCTKKMGIHPSQPLTIADLLDIGFGR